MSEPFLGEVRIFAGNFAPRGWAFCHGQLLPIASHSALFSLLGTIYGGDGRTTFALPDLRGRTPIGVGSGPGLTPRREGQRMGEERHTLTEPELPAHDHPLQASGEYPSTDDPANASLARQEFRGYAASNPTTTMRSGSVANAGGGQAHNNMQPSLAMNYIIALVGLYPSRS